MLYLKSRAQVVFLRKPRSFEISCKTLIVFCKIFEASALSDTLWCYVGVGSYSCSTKSFRTIYMH